MRMTTDPDFYNDRFILYIKIRRRPNANDRLTGTSRAPHRDRDRRAVGSGSARCSDHYPALDLHYHLRD
jgi:hypothetical protein